MNFKNYYSANINENLEKLDEFYSSLFEASENQYTLTSNGLHQLFDATFDNPPKVSKATRFIVLNPANEEDKKLIIKYKKQDFTRVVLFTLTKSRIVKPSIDENFFKVSKEFITQFGEAGLKAISPEQKSLKEKIKTIESKSSKETYFTLNDSEILVFLDMVKQSDPAKFAKGVYYYYDTQSEHLYEAIYNKKDSKFQFDNLFEITKAYEGPEKDEKFKLNPSAQELKDVMILGVFYDANELKQNLYDFKKDFPELVIPYEENSSFKNIVKPFEKALEQPELRRFNDILKRDYKKFGYDDWEGIFDLATGMSRFVSEVAKVKNPYIVFESIPEFKKLESEKFQLGDDEDTGKISRVDAILSDIPKDKLFSLLKNENTRFAPKNGSVEIYSNKKLEGTYWQITFDSKFIGRSQRYFSKLYGMIVKSKEVFEDYKTFEELLNENILDKLTSTAKLGASALKEIGKKFYDKIKYIVLAFKDWSENFRKSLQNEFSKNFKNDVYELYSLGLSESVKEEINELLPELLKNPKENFEKANAKINALVESLEKIKNHEILKVKFEKAETPKNINANTFKKQIFNYTFLKTLKNSVITSNKGLIDYVEELLGLYIEAAYGSTKLPIWKVSGGFSAGSYDYMGTKEKEKEERKKNILKNLEKELPLIFLNIEEVGNKGFHDIEMSIISNMISESGKFEPKYTKFVVDYDRVTLAPSFLAVSEGS